MVLLSIAYAGPYRRCLSSSMLDKMALGQVLLQVLQFSPFGIIPPMLFTRLFTNHRCCTPRDNVKILLMQQCLNEEFHNLFSPQNIIRTTKEDELGGADGSYGRGAKWTKLWPENVKGRNYCEDQGTEGKIKLKGSLNRVKVQIKLIGYDMKAYKEQQGYSLSHV